MMENVNQRKHSGQSGQASTEFIFAIIVSFGLFMLFFAITVTFSAVEITQYVAYSVARAHAGSHKTAADQKAAAVNKYKSFMKNRAFGPFFQSGWFVLGKAPTVKQGATLEGGTFAELSLSDNNATKSYTGVSIPFESKLLGLKVLFIDSGNQNDLGFKTNLNAIMIRESSQEECQEFWRGRANAIRQLLPSGALMEEAAYTPMEDNGC